LALGVRIKLRAQREIEQAADWWAQNRLVAPGAVRKDLEAALALLVEEPGIGTKVEAPRSDVVRRLYLPRVKYFVYYRVRGAFLEVVASGIRAAKKARWSDSYDAEPFVQANIQKAAPFGRLTQTLGPL